MHFACRRGGSVPEGRIQHLVATRQIDINVTGATVRRNVGLLPSLEAADRKPDGPLPYKRMKLRTMYIYSHADTRLSG